MTNAKKEMTQEELKAANDKLMNFMAQRVLGSPRKARAAAKPRAAKKSAVVPVAPSLASLTEAELADVCNMVFDFSEPQPTVKPIVELTVEPISAPQKSLLSRMFSRARSILGIKG